MKCIRTSIDNQFRNMGRAAANRGHSREWTSEAFIAPARGLALEGYDEEMAKRARAAERAGRAHRKQKMEG